MSSTEGLGGNAGDMAYIVTKQNRFYVDTYDGVNPITGKEQRRWHLAGNSRDDAEAIAANLSRTRAEVRDGEHSALSVSDFINATWMRKRIDHLDRRQISASGSTCGFCPVSMYVAHRRSVAAAAAGP